MANVVGISFQDGFKLYHQVIDGKHYLNINPELPVAGFSMLAVLISPEEWDHIKANFIIIHMSSSGVDKIIWHNK